MKWRKRSLWTWAVVGALVVGAAVGGWKAFVKLQSDTVERFPFAALQAAIEDTALPANVARAGETVLTKPNVVDRVLNTRRSTVHRALTRRLVPEAVAPKDVASIITATIVVPPPPPGDTTTTITISVTETTAGELLVKVADPAGDPIDSVSIVPGSVQRVTFRAQGWQLSPGGSIALRYDGTIQPAVVGAMMLYRWRLIHVGIAYDGRPGLMIAVDPGWHIRIGVYGTREAFGVTVGFGL